jgi:decaprenylphospho-beta-D-ribofuranose 2-oxidase
MELTGWGRFPRHESNFITPHSRIELERIQASLAGYIARGNGRAYGDAAIGTISTIGLSRLDRMQDFDPATGRLKVEAGVLLSDIIGVFLPRGFFPPVVPGTKFVTVGGMIAADIHGKNHHRVGGFGSHVESLTLILPSGEAESCSRENNADLFKATIGGMGLTGTIVDATFRLKAVETGWIRQRIVAARDLDAAMAALSEGDEATYSVAWIDSLARGAALGRSLIFLGEHATLSELHASRSNAPTSPPCRSGRIAVPFELPDFVLNRWSVGTFNSHYFRRGVAKTRAPFLTPWDSYFFPLDGIAAWNRIYGWRGFLQYQCVLPTTAARNVLGEILGRVSKRGDASFLAVLKKLSGSEGMISFPMPGFTLALDFSISTGIFPFLDEIDRLVVAAGGRLYLAKDARQSRVTFEAGYPAHGLFSEFRRTVDKDLRVRSQLSERLGL